MIPFRTPEQHITALWLTQGFLQPERAKEKPWNCSIGFRCAPCGPKTAELARETEGLSEIKS